MTPFDRAHLCGAGFSSCYTLGRRIGTGSYGTCFLAHDYVMGRVCCCKVIAKQRGKQKPEKVLRKIAQEADFLLRAQECLGVVQVRACLAALPLHAQRGVDPVLACTAARQV